MKELIQHIQDNVPFKVDKNKLFKFLYARKIKASTFYFKLLTCSRIERENYLSAFMEEGIYETDDKGNLIEWLGVIE